MKYYTFLPRFHESIRQGVKVSTIRQKTKVKVGERFALRFWTGRPYGSPMGILGTAVCTAVLPISIPIDPRPAIPRACCSRSSASAASSSTGRSSGPTSARPWPRTKGSSKLPLSGVLTRWDPASLEINVAGAQ